MYIPVSRSPSWAQGSVTLTKSPAPTRRLTLLLRPQNKPSSQVPAVACTSSGERIKSCMKKSTAACSQSGKVPRFVHFGATLEHTRWFYKSETPKHASADPRFESSPDHEPCADKFRLVAVRKPSPSFSPFEPSPVVLETVEYAKGVLTGTVKVHNLAFEKHVSVRLTTDEWKTVEDVTADFVRSVAPVDGVRPSVDRFRFKYQMKAEPTQVSVCVRYSVNGQEFWDNNQGANYCFKLAAALPAASSSKPVVSESPVRRAQNDFAFAAAAPARRSPSPSYGVSAADASRYMRYSEAAFNEPAAQSAGYPMFASAQWSPNVAYAMGGGHYYGDLRTSSSRSVSPVMRTGSPLAAPHVWSPQPTTLLHC